MRSTAPAGGRQVSAGLADDSAMRHFGIRGFGIRFALALVLPITGIGLVLWTVAQLLVYQFSHA